MSIGEKLQDARTRMGSSIREAAEATKIRGDVLAAFENNDFQVDLPDVYKRGFLRLYAKHLKLDDLEIMRLYTALEAELHPQNAQRPRISEQLLKRELFGQVQLDDEEVDEVPETSSSEIRASFWIRNKVLIVSIVSAFLFGFLIIGIISIFSEDAPAKPEVNQSLTTNPANLEEKLTLIAKEDVYVVVRQESDRQKLFVGQIKKGERVEITKKGPVKIQHTQGENLMLEKEGQLYSMSSRGVGVSLF